MSSANADSASLKCVFVGNATVGKTSLIVSYTTNRYPRTYVPTAFDNFSVVVLVDKKPIRLNLHDTAGQTSFDSLRPLCYDDADVFVVVFSVVDLQSFEDVALHWLPEIAKRAPGTRVVLVGTQCDLRWQTRTTMVLPGRATKLAQQIGAEFFECSALTQKNLKEMFDSMILAGLEAKQLQNASQKPKRPATSATKMKERVQRGEFLNVPFLEKFPSEAERVCLKRDAD